MHLFRVALAGFILLSAGSVFAQEWIEYVDRQEYFQINFPGQPTVQDITYHGEDDEPLPARVYTAMEGPATYTLTVVKYNDSETVAGAGGYRGSALWTAWQFLQRGGEPDPHDLCSNRPHCRNPAPDHESRSNSQLYRDSSSHEAPLHYGSLRACRLPPAVGFSGKPFRSSTNRDAESVI